jgi:hypothetical protein
MQSIYMRFASGRTFVVNESIEDTDKSKTPYFMFFDIEKFKTFFQIDSIFEKSSGSFFYLTPTKMGIKHATVKDGFFYVIVYGKARSAQFVKNHQNSGIADLIRRNGFFIITEDHAKPNSEIIHDEFACDIFKTVVNDYSVPISYSPFCNYAIPFAANKDNAKYLSLGGENKFDLAYLDGQMIQVSACIEKLEGLSEMEEMDRVVNATAGHIALKDAVMIGGYDHYSIVGNYLRKFGNVRRTNHLFSHLSAAMYDHQVLTESCLGIVYDSISYSEDESIQVQRVRLRDAGEFQGRRRLETPASSGRRHRQHRTLENTACDHQGDIPWRHHAPRHPPH